MDVQTLGLVVGAVIVVAVLLYVYDRRSKHQAVDVFDLAAASQVIGGHRQPNAVFVSHALQPLSARCSRDEVVTGCENVVVTALGAVLRAHGSFEVEKN